MLIVSKRIYVNFNYLSHSLSSTDKPNHFLTSEGLDQQKNTLHALKINFEETEIRHRHSKPSHLNVGKIILLNLLSSAFHVRNILAKDHETALAIYLCEIIVQIS